jgi:purine-binding chemotaxis protein CheW
MKEAESQKLFFKVLEKLLCFDISYVERIISLVELQSVPGSPPYFKGFLNLHQKEIPIVGLAECLGFEAKSNYSLDTLIILCEHEGKNMGLIVDEVLGIESIAQDALQKSELFKGEAGKYLNGIITTPNGDALLLDMDSLFKLEY